MAEERNVTATMENYLEAIYKLKVSKGAARVKDIASELGVAVSTVSGALRHLSSQGFVNYQPYEWVTLTEPGEEIARRTDRRHKLISRFFTEILHVRPEIAKEDACRMEHGISPETVQRLSAFMEFLDTCPLVGKEWVRGFVNYCENRCFDLAKCSDCIRGRLENVHNRMDDSVPAAVRPATLADLPPGEKATIQRLRATGAFARRLRDMGLVPGSLVSVIKKAPLGDPIEVKVKGYNLSLRREEAAYIEVEVEETSDNYA